MEAEGMGRVNKLRKWDRRQLLPYIFAPYDGEALTEEAPQKPDIWLRLSFFFNEKLSHKPNQTGPIL